MLGRLMMERPMVPGRGSDSNGAKSHVKGRSWDRLASQDLSPSVSQGTIWRYVAVDRRLGYAYSLPAPGSCRGQSSEGPFPDQLSFEFRQSREEREDKLSAGGRRVDAGPLAGEHPDPDVPVVEVLHQVDEVTGSDHGNGGAETGRLIRRRRPRVSGKY